MNARTYRPRHAGYPRPLGAMPADGSACGDGGCVLAVGHPGPWHDDGVACWPVTQAERDADRRRRFENGTLATVWPFP